MRATHEFVLSAGELARSLADLFVEIDAVEVETDSVTVAGFYDGQPRPTGIVRLHGRGHIGEGENVDWYPEDQTAFTATCPRHIVTGNARVEEISASLAVLDSGYHRAAIEAATIDLALKQAGLNLVALTRRRPRPLRFCWSLGVGDYDEDGRPLDAIERVLGAAPGAGLKIDVPAEGWPADVWGSLAAHGRIVVLDFKRSGDAAGVARAHAAIPDAWIEDPPLDALADRPAWAHRVALDGYITCAADLKAHASVTAAVNVKAARVGGPLEALRCIETSRDHGWEVYFGGMFEVGAGRRQARTLAAIFSPGAWNDLAPTRTHDDDPYAASPATIKVPEIGFSS